MILPILPERRDREEQLSHTGQKTSELAKTKDYPTSEEEADLDWTCALFPYGGLLKWNEGVSYMLP